MLTASSTPSSTSCPFTLAIQAWWKLYAVGPMFFYDKPYCDYLLKSSPPHDSSNLFDLNSAARQDSSEEKPVYEFTVLWPNLACARQKGQA